MACFNQPYRHTFSDTTSAPWSPAKVVCVGRNYADHVAELNNPLPEEPLLFHKPSTAITSFSGRLALAESMGEHHFETEVTLLIGKPLKNCDAGDALDAIAGVGIGLDLTLRKVQADLKARGLPWERSKAFDGSCVLSPFAPMTSAIDLQNLTFRLWRNEAIAQEGNTAAMIFPVTTLLQEISKFFSLLPGDVIMTGTPKGVGPLVLGDRLRAEIDKLVVADAVVEYSSD